MGDSKYYIFLEMNSPLLLTVQGVKRVLLWQSGMREGTTTIKLLILELLSLLFQDHVRT